MSYKTYLKSVLARDPFQQCITMSRRIQCLISLALQCPEAYSYPRSIPTMRYNTPKRVCQFELSCFQCPHLPFGCMFVRVDTNGFFCRRTRMNRLLIVSSPFCCLFFVYVPCCVWIDFARSDYSVQCAYVKP